MDVVFVRITRCGDGIGDVISHGDRVPFRAVLAGRGTVDATQDDLGAGLTWSALHRARPRPALTCPSCQGRVHAKVGPAPNQLRFFAHDAADRSCPLHGQSPEHYRLKAEVAAALRQAGWTATVEAAGAGWRADVLATSPDGQHRRAWEVQLSGISVDDVLARTAAMHESDVAVCWLTDRVRPPPWYGHVPALRLRTTHRPGETAVGGTVLAGGLLRFPASWCPDHDVCQHRPTGFFPTEDLPCPGHGQWEDAAAMSLTRLVNLVCSGQAQAHQAQLSGLPDRGQRCGTWVWTASCYVAAEQAQHEATAERLAAEQRLRRAERTHPRPPRTAAEPGSALAWQEQQYALIRPTEVFIATATGLYPEIPEWRGPSPQFAMGLPAFLNGRLCAVIMPQPEKVECLRTRSAWLVVATPAHRDALIRAGQPHRRIAVLPLD